MNRELQKTINDAIKAQEDEKKSEQLAALKLIVTEIIESHDIFMLTENTEFAMRYSDEIIYQHEFGSFKRDAFRWSFHTKNGLQMRFNDLNGEHNWKVFLDCFPQSRKKLGRASGISVPSQDLNLLQLKPIELVEGEAHWIFDALISSICGNKQENIDHLEQCLIHKRREPGNIFIPWIVLNDGGGTGKDLFTTTILSNLLGPWSCNPNLPLEKLVGKFGDVLEGICIALINEKPEDNESLGKLKSLNGSPSIVIEPKGKKPYKADAMLWAVLASNNTMGTVTLAQNDSDRRYSVISGDRPLKHYIAEILDRSGEVTGCSEDEATAWIKQVGQYILLNKQEFGKWMNKIIQKHGEKVCVNVALHGEDYRKLLNVQESTQVEIWRTIFNAEFEYIRPKLVWLYYLHVIDEDKARSHLGKKRFYAELDIWLRNNRPDIRRHLGVNWLKMNVPANMSEEASKVFKTKADIYGVGAPNGQYVNNDLRYAFFDEQSDTYKWKIGSE